MIGLAHANPSIMTAVLNFKQHVPFQVEGSSAEWMQKVRDYYARTENEPRRRLLMAVGVDTAKALEAAGFGRDAVVAVFDIEQNLAKDPRIQPADYVVKQTQAGVVYEMAGRLDFNAALRAAHVGFAEKKYAPDSLPAIFDPMIDACKSTKKRKRVGAWVAARIEGLLAKDEWVKVLGKAESYGLQIDLLTAGLRALKSSGKLVQIRKAAALVGGGMSLDQAVRASEATLDDLEWLDARWPLVNVGGTSDQP